MTIAATVWYPQPNQEGEYGSATVANLTDPVVTTTNITDPVSAVAVTDTGTAFTPIPSTTWSFDESL